MKIIYYRGKHPNFGDELNLWLWPRLMPGFFDQDERHLFIGIGSIISNKYNPKAKKIVFGAGYVPEYMDKPDISGGDWDILFVRGPRTARYLNISERLAIGDSAILIRHLIGARPRPEPQHISFMPHWASFDSGNWEEVCRLAGVKLIDPRRPVDEVLNDLLHSRMVITEAMHGAIVADALRIPWVPALPIHSLHRAKWFDWAEALDIDLRPHRLLPSTLEESHHAVMHRRFLLSVKQGISRVPILTKMTNKAVEQIAARRMRELTRMPPCLSTDRAIDRALDGMLGKMEALKRTYGSVREEA